MKTENKAFTLIELLVVIAIIGLLATVVMTSLNSARKKARDKKRLADFKNMSLALEMYYDNYGKYPDSPNKYSSGGCGPTNTHQASFEAVAQTLVDEGFLSAVPKDPINDSGNCYMLYKYAAGTAPGMLMVTKLETISPTTTPPYNSCRPFTNNWCSHTRASSLYCLCHPY